MWKAELKERSINNQLIGSYEASRAERSHESGELFFSSDQN